MKSTTIFFNNGFPDSQLIVHIAGSSLWLVYTVKDAVAEVVQVLTRKVRDVGAIPTRISMKPQEYILSQMKSLKAFSPLDIQPETENEIVDSIFKILMSKKFRKFSVPEENQKNIKAAIKKNVSKGEPIQIAWPYGAYKLWRLEETPEPDWAELFTMIYVARWLKPVCALYPKGVVFTFWSDEVVIGMMNNIPQSDLDTYRERFNDLLAFLKPSLPSNFQFEVFLERSQYENRESFEKELTVAMEELKEIRMKNPESLSEDAVRSIEMNVKVTPEQLKDSEWREKVDLMHCAYYNLQESKKHVRPSYSTVNITAFTVFFEPNVIPIGSAKTSMVRFWVGIGALMGRGDSFIEAILSPTQLKSAKYDWEPIAIEGLTGKNFTKIRLVR